MNKDALVKSWSKVNIVCLAQAEGDTYLRRSRSAVTKYKVKTVNEVTTSS